MGYAETYANLIMQQAAQQGRTLQDVANIRAQAAQTSSQAWGRLPGTLAALGVGTMNTILDDKRAREENAIKARAATVAEGRLDLDQQKEDAAAADRDAERTRREAEDRANRVAKSRESFQKLLPSYVDVIHGAATGETAYAQRLPTLKIMADHAKEAELVPPDFAVPAWSAELPGQLTMLAGWLAKSIEQKPQSGTVVGQGAAYIPPGATAPSFTNPAAPKTDMTPQPMILPDGTRGFGVYDPQTKTLIPVKGGSPIPPPPSATVINQSNREAVEIKFDDLMKDTPDGKPNPAMQAMLDGRQSVDKVVMGTAGRVDPTQKFRLITKLQSLDPNFSEQRAALRYKFDVAGLEHNRILALDTMAKHLGLVKQLSSALEAKDMPLANRLINYGKTQFGWSPMMSADMAATALGTEIASALKGTNAAATDPEINKWVSTLPTSQSPGQWKGNLQTGADIVIGRAYALQEDWQKVYGAENYYPIFSKKSQEYLRSAGGDPSVVMGPVSTQPFTPVDVRLPGGTVVRAATPERLKQLLAVAGAKRQ